MLTSDALQSAKVTLTSSSGGVGHPGGVSAVRRIHEQVRREVPHPLAEPVGPAPAAIVDRLVVRAGPVSAVPAVAPGVVASARLGAGVDGLGEAALLGEHLLPAVAIEDDDGLHPVAALCFVLRVVPAGLPVRRLDAKRDARGWGR